MELLNNKTNTVCFFSLDTDLEKSYICIQLYLNYINNNINNKAIILYDGLENPYYSQLKFARKHHHIKAEALTGKSSINVEDFSEYDFIIFDISQQNYNIYEGFLYNSQLIFIVNNSLESVYSKELELAKTVHHEVINQWDTEKLFPVSHCNLILNNFNFMDSDFTKAKKKLSEDLRGNTNITITGVLNCIEDKDIFQITNDSSYSLLFSSIFNMFNPEDDESLFYGDDFNIYN